MGCGRYCALRYDGTVVGNSTLTVLLALAGPDGLDVTWRAPHGCGSAEDVTATVGEFMSREVPASLLSQVRIEAIVTGSIDNPVVDVRVATPLGELQRKVEAETCDAAVDAAAVVIAVALDPLAVVEAARTPPEDGPNPAVAPSPEAVPPPRATEVASSPTPVEGNAGPEPVALAPRTPARRWPLGGSVRAMGLVDRGSLEGTAGGPRLALGLTVGRARVELAGTYLAPREVLPFGDAAGAGVRVQLGEVSALGCFVPRVSQVEFPTCAGFGLGAMRGDGVGLGAPTTSHDFWAIALVSAGVGWVPTPRFALWLQAEGGATLYRPAFVVDDLGVAFRAGPAAVRAILGPELRFP